MNNKLQLADAGYPDFHFFSELQQHGGFYIVRGAKSLNPMIIGARNGQGDFCLSSKARSLKTLLAVLIVHKYSILKSVVVSKNLELCVVGVPKRSGFVFG